MSQRNGMRSVIPLQIQVGTVLCARQLPAIPETFLVQHATSRIGSRRPIVRKDISVTLAQTLLRTEDIEMDWGGFEHDDDDDRKNDWPTVRVICLFLLIIAIFTGLYDFFEKARWVEWLIPFSIR
jgi:hypothetical protein